jgi:hypothetical protein
MMMQITKNIDKPHVICYIRDDGSKTWMHADNFFVLHDLSHYAIEKILGYTTAFMGMLNKGMDIKDFENREKRKTVTMTNEARNSEQMANLFLMEVAQGNLADFNDTLKETFAGADQAFDAPVVTNNQLAAIRKHLRELYKSWEDLPAGETMSLVITL